MCRRRSRPARGIGILRRHLPNAMAPLIVQLSFLFAYAVLSGATLSFLGMTRRPPPGAT